MIESLRIYSNKRDLQREAYKFIRSYVDMSEINKIGDLFAGTASLSTPFFRHANEILLNDKYKFLYYYLCFYTNRLEKDFEIESKYFFKILKNMDLYKGGIYENYVENKEYAFWGKNDAIQIDSVHKYLHDIRGNMPKEAFASIYGNFIYSVYQASNIRNGLFFIKPTQKIAKDNIFNFKYREANDYFAEKNIKVFNEDAKGFVQTTSGDLLIIDPPFKRKNISLYYPLEYLANDPYKPINKLFYEDEYSYLNNRYIRSLINLIRKASYKYIFLYLDDKVFDMFPPLYFELFIYKKMKLKNGYFVLLEKI